MPAVYVTSLRTDVKFHRVPDCPHVRKPLDELVMIELDELPKPTPCLICYPDAPRARSLHRRCKQCNKTKAQPCPHNGGVPVLMTRTRRKASLLMDEGQVYTRTTFVWPEHARHYKR